MARPEFEPRHVVFVYALAIVIAFIAFVVMAVMSMISIILAMVSVVMSLVSMVLISMIFVAMILRHIMAVIFMPAILRHVMAVIFMPTILRHIMAVVIPAMVFMRHVMAVIFVAMIFMRYVMAVVLVTILGSAVVLAAIFPAFFSGMVFAAIFTPLSRVFMPFFLACSSRRSSFRSCARYATSCPWFSCLIVMMLRVVTDGIRMVIFVAVHPGALPRRVIDEHHATVPGNAVIAPSPWTISNSQRNAKAEAYCGANEESRTRPLIDHNRIVGWDHNVVRTRRHDRNIRSTAHDDLRACAQYS